MSPRNICYTVSYIYLLARMLILINMSLIVASHVCKDLVLYDAPAHNAFRDLIPLTHHYPALLQIIIANSALHMSNACQKSPLMSSVMQQRAPYNDALLAKQRALHLLQNAISAIALMDVDVTLAVVLLFIELELIDSGRDEWRYHIDGARTIINRLCASEMSVQTAMSPLRSCLISNCLV